MKRFLTILILIFCSFLWLNSSNGEEIAVFIDGERQVNSLFIYHFDERDYVALADIETLLNLPVSWDVVSQRAVLKTNKGEISFLVNNPRIIVNEEIKRLNYPARLFNGGVIVPMQFLVEYLPEILSYKITWEMAQRRLEVKTKDKVIIGEDESYPQVELSSVELEEEKIEKNLKRTEEKKKENIPGSYRIELVVIDPGHGGRDPGAIGRKGLKEKDVVLDVAQRVARLLKDNGIKVLLTRSQDNFVSLDERTAIANRNRADLFLSIHANAAFSRRAGGFETYYVSEAIDDHARAVAAIENSVLELEREGSQKKLDDTLHAILWDLAYTEFRVESIEWGEIVQQELNKKLRSENRGVKPGPFYVLKGAQMPSLLVEIGFISNVVEESNLRKSSYRDDIARALANSLIRYKKIYEKRAGFTQ